MKVGDERGHRRDRLVHPALPAEAVSAVRDMEGLKGKESVFKSPESGSQGMFLGGDRVLRPEGPGDHRGARSRLRHVVAGAESAQVARWSQLYKQKKPVIFYWYDQQYLNGSYDLVHVKLPPRTAKCKDDEKGWRSEAVRVRLPVVSAQHVLRRGVRGEWLTGGRCRQEVHVDGQGSERSRVSDRRQEDEAGQGCRGVGEGEPRQGQRLAQVAR